MPHFTKCRTNLDHRDVVRAADGAAEDVRSNHPHNRSARRHSPSARRRFAILVVPRREVVAPRHVMREGHQRGAVPEPAPYARSMRSAQERPA